MNGTKLVAIARMGYTQQGGTWEEEFDVTSQEAADAEVRGIIEWFNNTRKGNESERKLLIIIRVEEQPDQRSRYYDRDGEDGYHEEDDDI